MDNISAILEMLANCHGLSDFQHIKTLLADNCECVQEIVDDRTISVWNESRSLFFVRQVIAAFNASNQELWKYLAEVSFCFDDGAGVYVNDGMLSCMKFLREKHGRMELCYIRLNDTVFLAAPYITDYGYFDISYGATGKIAKLSLVKADHVFLEVLHTNEYYEKSLFDDVPQALSCEFLRPEETQRFAVKVRYAGGSVKKYRLPFNHCQDEVVAYQHYVFTDKIFANGYLNGNDICFINGYRMTAAVAFLEGTEFSEPEVSGEQRNE